VYSFTRKTNLKHSIIRSTSHPRLQQRLRTTEGIRRKKGEAYLKNYLKEHNKEFKFLKHRANSIDCVDLRLDGKNKYRKELDCVKRNYGTDVFFHKVVTQSPAKIEKKKKVINQILFEKWKKSSYKRLITTPQLY